MPTVSLRAGDYMIKNCSLDGLDDGTIRVKFPFNKKLIEEVKSFEGSRWNPEKKHWTIKNSQRNQFQLTYLTGGDPYAWYDQPLKEYNTDRPARNHQIRMVRHTITYRRLILAAEMGTGKSLAAILALEWAKIDFESKYPGQTFICWWIAPKSALRSVELELDKWKSQVKPKLYTYDSLKTTIQRWVPGTKAPYFVVFDESSRVKTPTAQRSQAAYELANGVRDDWGQDGFVVLMSGTPAPKSPADWYWQCEIAQPGFIKEGTYDKFKKRLGLIIQKESISQGGVYPHLVTWLDDENKCLKCGLLRTDPNHDPQGSLFGATDYHEFVQSVNEVAFLYERMKGLTEVIFKKDCLDLPDKQYEIIRCRPTPSILRSASIISANSKTVVGAMILLRELSDGFQYEQEEIGTSQCSECHGEGEVLAHTVLPDIQIVVTEDNLDDYPDNDIGDIVELPRSIVTEDHTDKEMTTCPKCSGSGEIVNTRTIAIQIPCPKEDVVKELLDKYDDDGRTVFFGGFTGSIDRLETICRSQEWHVVRCDGRGWHSTIPGLKNALDMLRLFQDKNNEEYPRIAFIGHPGSAGMGLTLTASPMICYYSNDFNAESRIQSEDRIHRMGMDVNLGATIYDIFHLPTDELVYENLKKKRKLQAMSMGDVASIIQNAGTGANRAF